MAVAVVVKGQMRALAIAAALLLATVAPLCACGANARPKRVQVTSSPVSVQATIPSRSPGHRLLLHLDDVVVPDGEAAIVRIFVNASSAAEATSTSTAGLVNEIFLVPRTSRVRPSAPGTGQNFVFPIPPNIQTSNRITITLVPVAPDERGELTAPGKTHLSMRPPYVTQER